jgi:hypothetical protein
MGWQSIRLLRVLLLGIWICRVKRERERNWMMKMKFNEV